VIAGRTVLPEKELSDVSLLSRPAKAFLQI
jgi:hypothetical protein